MPFSVTAVLGGLKSFAAHPITQGGALGALVSGGLEVALLAGVAIPGWAFTAGPLAGYLLYKALPKPWEQKIDDTATYLVNVAGEVPSIEKVYPQEAAKLEGDQQVVAVSNINPDQK